MNRAELRRWAGQSRRLRAGRIRVLQAASRLSKTGAGPPIFLNSIPKAGTHLLSQALDEMPGIRATAVHLVKAEVMVAGPEPEERRELDWTKVRQLLTRSARAGQYVTAHTWAHPQLFDLLDELGYAQLFVIRDPRDVVVSQSVYVTRLGRHRDHRRFASGFDDDQERYRAIIEGYPEDDRGPAGVPLLERLVGYAPWLDRDGVVVSRFEDLIGPAGGGDRQDQLESLTRVAAAVGVPLEHDAIKGLAERVWSPRAATFHKGRIGGWRESFDEATKASFARHVPSELMARYGYLD